MSTNLEEISPTHLNSVGNDKTPSMYWCPKCTKVWKPRIMRRLCALHGGRQTEGECASKPPASFPFVLASTVSRKETGMGVLDAEVSTSADTSPLRSISSRCASWCGSEALSSSSRSVRFSNDDSDEVNVEVLEFERLCYSDIVGSHADGTSWEAIARNRQQRFNAGEFARDLQQASLEATLRVWRVFTGIPGTPRDMHRGVRWPKRRTSP